MNIEPKIKIEVAGHKAEIGYIRAQVAYSPWYKDDYISVMINLESPINSLAGFSIALPVKDYGKEEFISAVIREAEKELPERLRKHREEREEMLQREQRQRSLDSIVEKIKSRLE